MLKCKEDCVNYINLKKLEIMHDLEEYKIKLLQEMGSVDKDTLTHLRQIIASYHALERNVALTLEGINKRLLDLENKVRGD